MQLTKLRRDNGPGILWILWLRKEFSNSLSLKVNTGWNSKYKRTALEFTFGGEENDFGFALCLWWVSLYVSLRGVFSHGYRSKVYFRLKERCEREAKGDYAYQLSPFEGRTTGLRFFEKTIWIDIWRNRAGWRMKDNPGFIKKKGRYSWQWGILPWRGWGWNWNIDLVKLLLGPTAYDKEVESEVMGFVTLPEGHYLASVEIKKVRWRRTGLLGRLLQVGHRWSWNAKVEVEKGIPVPGKGTTGYNCGDDAIFSVSTAAEDTPPVGAYAFLQYMAMRVIETRQRYASLEWVPREGWPAHLKRTKATG